MSDAACSPRLRDRHSAADYRRNGFCTIPLLGREAVRTLRCAFARLFPHVPEGFLSTVLQPPAIRRSAHEAIVAILEPALSQHLDGYRIVLSSFVARSAGSGEDDLPLHQDWSFVDERLARSVSVWVPLQGVSAANGCLQVVPGSHAHEQPLRGIGSGFRYRAVEAALRTRYLVDLPLRAGEAIFFDHRLIHGSRANGTRITRRAVGAVLVPRDMPLFMGRRIAAHAYDFAQVSDDFLLDSDLGAIARQ